MLNSRPIHDNYMLRQKNIQVFETQISKNWARMYLLHSSLNKKCTILQTDKFRRKCRLVVSLCRASGHRGQCA